MASGVCPGCGKQFANLGAHKRWCALLNRDKKAEKKVEKKVENKNELEALRKELQRLKEAMKTEMKTETKKGSKMNTAELIGVYKQLLRRNRQERDWFASTSELSRSWPLGRRWGHGVRLIPLCMQESHGTSEDHAVLRDRLRKAISGGWRIPDGIRSVPTTWDEYVRQLQEWRQSGAELELQPNQRSTSSNAADLPDWLL